MSQRKPLPIFADIYPEGEYTCMVCQSTNHAGESFRMNPSPFNRGYICSDCYDTKQIQDKAKQKELYKTGEDEPEFLEDITCPWCGTEYDNSFEFPDEEEIDCHECQNLFIAVRHVEVTYSTERLENN